MHNDYNVNSNLELIIMINAHARFTPMLTIETKMCHVLIMCKTINSYIYMYIYTSTIKSPSAVQISKSLKQTQSIDKI